MKIKAYEKFIGSEKVYSYIGIRADENREGYISNQNNIVAVYPFKEEGVDRAGVYKILEDSGLGLPKYYEWRSRSGCYFCFFQRTIEWVGLLEKHPDLLRRPKPSRMGYKGDDVQFTWVQGRTLDWIRKNKEEIKLKHNERMLKQIQDKPAQNIHDVFAKVTNEDDLGKACIVCDL